jgi:FtsP/CotA-like multicopper oxidase with cupredoxin domain
LAHANAAFGTNTDIAGNVINVPTYYASSPQGVQPAFDPVTHALSITGLTVDTGTPIRKFIDPLGGVYNGLENLPGVSDLQSGIPVGLTEKWMNPLTNVQTTDDYYEIAIVEFTQRLHTDLAKATRLRAYVQIETASMGFGSTGKKDITGLISSEHIPATYPDGSPIYKMKRDPQTGLMVQDTTQRVYFVHKPHALGPVILAAKGTPVRIKFTNYLPYTDSTGRSVGSWNGMGGESFVPVDETIAGGGPVLKGDGTPQTDQLGRPIKMAQNRASIHWHGGDSPWISDGTPHQWFTPAGDISYTIGDALHPVKDANHPNGVGMGKGDSAADVPDMPPSGDGSYTTYFPNHLSGRLMLYHDHTSGMTKVNVYMGMGAGYLVYDPIELTLAANALGTTLGATVTPATGPLAGKVIPTGLLDAVGIPLVIQDKTFVPKNIGPNAVASDGSTSASQDAKWDTSHWGQEGDFYFPHVYETNQDPNSADGTNPVGRWDWGPWFWPVFPAQFSLPSGAYGDATATPEAFLDTSMVNGQAYPTMTVDPKTYRFRILSVANDRSHNLGLYQAVDASNKVCDNTNLNPVVGAPMAGGLPLAACTEVRLVPAAPTVGFPATWPTDGRTGGVPDPATAGPDIVQIGSEGGLLPAPAIWKSQPVNYDQNVRNITVFNITDHDLLLMGGERADVLVDFTKYAGHTLLMYNDAPAPMPGLDPRIDYYTGMGDFTGAGGAYDVLAGYGPNTRTVMQIKVNATNLSGTGGPLDVTALAKAMPAAYAATQPKPVIPQVVYNAPFGTSDVNNYAAIGTGSGAIDTGLFSFTTTTVAGVTVAPGAGGSGYLVAPNVTISGGGGTGATATAMFNAAGAVSGITVTNPGTGYTSDPLVAISAPPAGGVNATATATRVQKLPVINKAIQELFDPIYGRMNATLAVELPLSTATVATTIPLAYVDSPVERLDAIKDGETQIWKVTHNGVDGHPVHFHMVNVQVINRVAWDGQIRPPELNELGWKETLRMNPLEDVYVAVRAAHPIVPFGVPGSKRLLDPAQVQGGGLGFTNINPTTGQAPTTQTYLVNGVMTAMPTAGVYTNELTDFDNEYVWHCHILGHEEQDFMRPFVFHPTVLKPDMPVLAVATGVTTLNWTDPTPYGGVDVDGVPTAGLNAALNYVEPTSNVKNEIGFKVQEQGAGGAWTTVAIAPANVTTWNGANSAKTYRVLAYNVAGDSVPSAAHVVQAAPGTPAAAVAPGAAPILSGTTGPTGLTQVLNGDGTFTLSWTGIAGATGYTVTYIETTGAVPPVVKAPVTAIVSIVPPATVPATTYTTAALAAGSTFTFSVTATTLSGTTAATTVAGGLTNSQTAGPVAFTGAAGSAPGTISLTWANNPLNKNNVAGLNLTWTGGPTLGKTFPATSTGVTLIGLTKGTSYSFSLHAVSNVTTFNSATVALPAAIVAP